MEKDLEKLAKDILWREYICNNHSVEETIKLAMQAAIELYKSRE